MGFYLNSWGSAKRKTVPKHRFSCLLELHGNQAEAQDEESSDNSNSNISLGVLTGQQGDQSVSNTANTNTIGDGIGQRHHDQSQECRNSGANIVHIYLSKALEHQNANIDQSGSSCTCGNQLLKFQWRIIFNCVCLK